MTFFSETPVPWISPALIAHINVNLVEMLMGELPGASKYILYWIMGILSKVVKTNLDSVIVLPDVVLVAVLRLRIISPLLNSRSISNELFFSTHHQLLHSQERMMS